MQDDVISALLEQGGDGCAQRAGFVGSTATRNIEKRNRAGLANGDGKICRLHGSYPICRGSYSTCEIAGVCRKFLRERKQIVNRALFNDAEGICRSQLLAHNHAQTPAPAFRKPHANDLKFRRETIQELVRCRMESQRRRDEIDKRRSLLQGNAWKIAIASDLSALQLPANTQPVIRGLKR